MAETPQRHCTRSREFELHFAYCSPKNISSPHWISLPSLIIMADPSNTANGTTFYVIRRHHSTNGLLEPQAESSSSSKAPEVCAQCSKTGGSLKPCNKCHTTLYCGKDCQKAHFKTHKKVCASLAQEYVKNNEPKMASRSVGKSTDRNTGFKKWEVSEFSELC